MRFDHKRGCLEPIQDPEEIKRIRAPLGRVGSMRCIDHGKIEARKSSFVHLRQGAGIERLAVEAVHCGQRDTASFHDIKHTPEEGNIEVQHVILEVNGPDPHSCDLVHLIFDAFQRPPAIRDERLAAKTAVERAAPRGEKECVRVFADTVIFDRQEISRGYRVYIVLGIYAAGMMYPVATE